MTDGPRDNADGQFRAECSDLPNPVSKTGKGLFKQVVGVGQPEHFVAAGEGTGWGTEKLDGGKCFPTAGR